MPKRYRKRYRKKRSAYGGYLNTATKALSVAYAVKRLVNVEFKHHNIRSLGTAITDAGVVCGLIGYEYKT